MSVEATTWVLTQLPADTPPVERMVLIGLANHAHSDGRNAWLSNAKLADYVGCSVRSVFNHLQSLESKGLIRRGDQEFIPAKIPSNRRPVVWDLAMEKTRSDGMQNLHPRVDRHENSGPLACKTDSSGMQAVADKPKPNQEINQRARPRANPIPSPGAPDHLAALRGPECEHGSPVGRCAFCRGATRPAPARGPADPAGFERGANLARATLTSLLAAKHVDEPEGEQ